jgi:hypothetical protein
MEYMVDYLPEKKIVSVKMMGRLNFQIAEQYSKEAVKLARQNDCTKFLFDHTETLLHHGINKIHMAGEELQQFGFKNIDRIAIVLANKSYNPDLKETVNQNSRWSVLQYFCADDIKDAFNWLSEIE